MRDLRLGSLRTLVVLLSLLAGCTAEIGEECDEIGDSDECEDGAICTNEASGGICRAICAETTDCPASHTCNGISGTNVKSCQPDDLKK